MKSMTGYGTGIVEEDGYQIKCEISSVNHRYFEAKVVLPENFENLKVELTQYLRNSCIRGKYYVKIAITGSEDKIPSINMKKADLYIKLYRELSDKVDFGELDFVSFLSLPEILSKETAEQSLFVDKFKRAIDKAVISMNMIKEEEGKAIEEFILKELEIVEEIVSHIKKSSGDLKAKKIEMAKKRVEELSLDKLSQNCVEQEIVYLADRYDISEEIQRLETHIHNFKTMLQKQHVGKKMGFLLQEMGREVNTIGSKLPDNDISFEVVKIKDSLEKIREQVQNVE
ncbi:YicC family protein [candidate division TA06 bacterium]|uniref:YicC family protein n=1 Tax=candidate division TA06 bacterium TaxID=2250710 RepID=A0A660S4U5_UNCT6|nr:MAG: YicC family protein [candidate division TA06 bacterium]